jgi:anti-sigma B factor antagonist
MDVAVTRPDTRTDPAVLSLSGQLDLDTAARLRTAFDELAGDRRWKVVVDLSGLDFCDSIGLSTIVVGHRLCAAQGGWLSLAAPTPFMVRLLSSVGIFGSVPVYGSVDGARRADPADRIQPIHDGMIDDVHP